MSLRCSYEDVSCSQLALWEVGETQRLMREFDGARQELIALMEGEDEESIAVDARRFYELLQTIQGSCLGLLAQEQQLGTFRPCDLDEHSNNLLNGQKRELARSKAAVSSMLMGAYKQLRAYESLR